MTFTKARIAEGINMSLLFDEKNHKEFFEALGGNGYHIFSREHARKKKFYPDRFPSDPEVDINDLQKDDRITIRAFFSIGEKPMARVESGLMDLRVEHVDRDADKVVGTILTELPPRFPLAKGTTLILSMSEVFFEKKAVSLKDYPSRRKRSRKRR